MLTWQWTRFAGLSRDDVYDMLALRSRIFVLEQTCAYLDPDGLDRQSWHLLGRGADAGLLAYARACDPGVRFGPPSIGRVVVDASRRGRGWGHVLVAQTLRRCDETWPRQRNRISALAHLQGFYGRHGYVPAGDSYLQDGVPYIDMERPAS